MEETSYKRPKLKPCDIIPMEGDRLQVRYMGRVFVLEGAAVRELLPTLLPLLQGELTVQEIEERSGLEHTTLDQLLKLFAAKNLLEEGDGKVYKLSDKESKALERYRGLFAAFHKDGLQIGARLQAARASVLGDGHLADHIAGELASLGVGTTRVSRSPGKNAGSLSWQQVGEYNEEVLESLPDAFTIVAFPAFPLGILQDVNRVFHRRRINWLPVFTEYMRAVVGPLVFADASPCFKCYELRLHANQDHFFEYRDYLRYRAGSTGGEEGLLPPFMQQSLVSLPVLEAVRVLTECEFPTLLGYALELNLMTMESSKHLVLRLPRCPVCSRVNSTPVYDHYFVAE